MAIKLYWHGGDTGQVNFGDTISPMIVEMVTGKPVMFADVYRCDMIAIGSLLDKVIRRRWKRLARMSIHPITVWGTGSFGSPLLSKHFRLNPLAVRGVKTRDAMGLPPSIALGDPGLFIDQLAARSGKSARWGIVPHVSDFTLPVVREICNQNPNSKVINLANPDMKSIVDQIAACDFIISSSLHGIIAADALGIPNIWMSLSNNINGADWKFADYFSSVGRSGTQAVSPSLNLADHERDAVCAAPSRVNSLRADLEAAIRSAF